VFLFKSSGATYRKVIKHAAHAFQYSPAEVNGDELVLLSMNREDCKPLEKQIRAVAKLDQVRKATGEELESFFPGVAASVRWKFAVELYWVRPLSVPFNLSAIKGFNATRYKAVQGFARLDDGDDLAVVQHLIRTNPIIVLDILNNADSALAQARASTR
jgi:hypothetical protein